MRSLLLVLALLAAGAQAEEEGTTPCDNVENDQQSLECSIYNRKTAETELGEAYRDLLDRTNNQYADHPVQLSDLLARIKAAQDLWAKLRDADCAVDTFTTAKGTPAYSVAQNDCVAQKSDERSEYLQTVGADSESDSAIPLD